jgi:hypothetical protein
MKATELSTQRMMLQIKPKKSPGLTGDGGVRPLKAWSSSPALANAADSPRFPSPLRAGEPPLSSPPRPKCGLFPSPPKPCNESQANLLTVKSNTRPQLLTCTPSAKPKEQKAGTLGATSPCKPFLPGPPSCSDVHGPAKRHRIA